MTINAPANPVQLCVNIDICWPSFLTWRMDNPSTSIRAFEGSKVEAFTDNRRGNSKQDVWGHLFFSRSITVSFVHRNEGHSTVYSLYSRLRLGAQKRLCKKIVLWFVFSVMFFCLFSIICPVTKQRERVASEWRFAVESDFSAMERSTAGEKCVQYRHGGIRSYL